MHRSQDAIDALLATGDKQSAEPLFGGKLVVIDEGNEIPGRVLERPISRQCDILFGFGTIGDANRGRGGEFRDNLLCGFRSVIIHHDHRKSEQTVAALATQSLQEPPQELRSLIGANAHTDMVDFHGSHLLTSLLYLFRLIAPFATHDAVVFLPGRCAWVRSHAIFVRSVDGA